MIQNNILIANFLGLEKQEDNTYFDYESCEYINQEDLNYNESWDMLMQVVEKIETTSCDVPLDLQRGFMKNTSKATGSVHSMYDDREEFKGWSSYAEIGTKTIWDSTMLGESNVRYNTKKEAVYNACVEFIEWWNRETKSKN